MFSSFMVNTWVAASIVAVVGGLVGFFVVLRGSAFVAHAIPHGAFSGAAGAALLGLNTVLGLGVFALAGALGIGVLGRKGRHDVATALGLVAMLATGALFLSWSAQYAPQIYALLFGEVLGVSRAELWPIAGLALVCLAAVALLYRPLMLSSIAPELGEVRGVPERSIDTAFLLVVALATAMTVPVVGALLMFSLMVAPAGAARSLSDRPSVAIVWSIALALVTVWVGIALSYLINWPLGFFVGTLGAAFYGLGRLVGARRRRIAPPVARPAGGTGDGGSRSLRLS